MQIEFTRRGRYEVWLDGIKLSEHNQEREATERIINHAAQYGDGEYEIKGYLVVAKVYGVLNPQEGDVEAPSVPQNVVVEQISATELRVSWDASTDNVGVIEYQLYRDSVPVNLGFLATTYDDSGLSPSTQYSYQVAASDAAGNTSDLSVAGLGTTAPNSAPVWSISNQSADVGQSYSLNLNTVCGDSDGDPITYTIEAGSLPAGLSLVGDTVSGTPTTAGAPQVTFGASDGIAAVQTAQVTYTVTEQDVTAPAAPTGLSLAPTSSTMQLSWTANSEPDLASYNVYRSTDGVSFGLRANVGTNSFLDSGLSSSTTYWYYLTALDATGNESSAGATSSQQTSSPPSGYSVYPIEPEGIFANDTGLTNQSATWVVTNENPLAGAFTTYRNGGGFDYVAASETGQASFDYTILDFDGQGSNTQATVTINIGGTPVWLDQSTIDDLPTSGAVWDALYARATSIFSDPIGGNDDIADTNTLACALVAATGDSAMLTKTRSLLSTAAAQAITLDTSLSASRNLTSYAIAADLINYNDVTFVNWAKQVVARDFEAWGAGQDGNPVGRGSLFWKIWKVNNHGTMAMAAFAALSRYLQRLEPNVQQWTDNLDHVFQCLRFYMGEDPSITPASLGYDSETLWNFGPNSENWQQLIDSNYYVIYPQGATYLGNSIDGLLPEAARRGSATYVYPAPNVSYYWEFMQGLTVTLEIMDRAGYTVYPLGNYAHRRAAQYLYNELGYPITGDDAYQAPLLDFTYGVDAIQSGGLWDQTSVDQGKNMGWTGWTHGLRNAYEPYDLSGLVNNSFSVTWPTVPNTSSTTNVSNSTELQNALNAGSTRIVMAAGTYSGSSLSFGADDVDIVAGDNVNVLFTQVNMFSRERIRITGGNWGALGTPMRWSMRGSGGNGLNDILWNDFNFYGRIETLGGAPSGTNVAARRLAFINTTFDGDAANEYGLDGNVLLIFNNPASFEDVTFCNVKMDNASGGNYVNRIHNVNRLMIYECASNMKPSYPGTVSGLRLGEETGPFHVQDTLVGNRIFGSLQSPGDLQQFFDGWFENVTKYTRTSGASPWATYQNENPPNDAVVNNCTTYSDTGGVGSPFSLGTSLTTGPDGNALVLGYSEPSGLPDTTGYGAQR